MGGYLLSRLRLQRKAFVATGLAVGLAVAFVVVVLGATATLKQLVGDAAAPRARAADLVALPDLRGDAHYPTDAEVARVRALPGVVAASAVRRAGLVLGWPDGAAPTVLESLPQNGLAWYSVVAGQVPRSAGEVLVDERTARRTGLSAGDRLPVSGAGDDLPRALVVTGTFRLHGVQPFSRTVLAAEQDVVRWGTFDGNPPPVEEVDVSARPGTDLAALTGALRGALPGLTVRTGPGTADAVAREQTRDVDVVGRLVLGFTAIALVVAMIVIANTFAILLAQRSREIALLRCVGATRRQVRRATLVEAAVLGLVASAAGAALGVALLVVAAAAAPWFWDALTGLRPVVGPVTVALPLAVGVVVTALSAALPTRRAARVAPLAALRPETASRVRRTSRLRLAAAALVGLLGTGLVALAVRTGGRGGVLAGIAGGAGVVLAVVLASPVVVPAVTRLVGAPLTRLGPVARIAVGNTRRNATRSAATSTALFLGVCLISVLTVGAATTVAAVDRDIDASTPVDVALMSGAESVPPGSAKVSGLPAGLAGDLSRVDGISAVTALRGSYVRFAAPGATGDKGATGKGATGGVDGTSEGGVLGADPTALAAVVRTPLPLDDRSLLVPADRFEFGGSPAGARPGERVVLRKGGRSVTLTVRSVPHLPQLLVTGRVLDRLGATGGTFSVWARAQDGVDPVKVAGRVTETVRRAGAADLRAAAAGRAAVGDYYDAGRLQQRAEIVQVMRVLVLVSTGLLGVAVLISLVGVANTLSLSVLERARESAVSRAVGMTRRQLRLTLAVEAVLLAAVGCVLGVLVGTALGWAGSVTLLSGVAQVPGPVVPLGRTALVVGVALAAALLASVLPGRRAARVGPVQALAEA